MGHILEVELLGQRTCSLVILIAIVLCVSFPIYMPLYIEVSISLLSSPMQCCQTSYIMVSVHFILLWYLCISYFENSVWSSKFYARSNFAWAEFLSLFPFVVNCIFLPIFKLGLPAPHSLPPCFSPSLFLSVFLSLCYLVLSSFL